MDRKTGHPYFVRTTGFLTYEDDGNGNVVIANDCVPPTVISSICVCPMDQLEVDLSGRRPICVIPSVCVSAIHGIFTGHGQSTITIKEPRFTTYWTDFNADTTDMGTLTLRFQGMTREAVNPSYALEASLFNKAGTILPQMSTIVSQPTITPKIVVGKALVDSMCMLCPPIRNGPTETPAQDLATLNTLANVAKLYYQDSMANLTLAEVVSVAMLPFYRMADITVHSTFGHDFWTPETRPRSVFVGLQRVHVTAAGHDGLTSVPITDDVSVLSVALSAFRMVNQLARTATAEIIDKDKRTDEPISQSVKDTFLQKLRDRNDTDAAKTYEDKWSKGEMTVRSFSAAHRAQVYQLHVQLEELEGMYANWIKKHMPPSVELSLAEAKDLSRFMYHSMTHGFFPACLSKCRLALYMVPLDAVSEDHTVHRASLTRSPKTHPITSIVHPFVGVPQPSEKETRIHGQLEPIVGPNETPERWMSQTCMHTHNDSTKLPREVLNNLALMSPLHFISSDARRFKSPHQVVVVDPYITSTDTSEVDFLIDGETFRIRLV